VRVTTWLRLRSFFARPDWYIELCDAYVRRRWDDVLYCLQQDPSLLKREVLATHATPFILCVESGDPRVVRAALDLGADVETVCQYVAGGEDGHRRYLEPPTWRHFFLTMNGLAIARLLGHEAVHQLLLHQTREHGQGLAMQACLLLGDEMGARALGLARARTLYAALRAHPPSPTTEVVPPVTAALLGDCGRDFVMELLQLCGEDLAREPFRHAPGYGHDNDEVYGGTSADWARLLHREDLVGLIPD
jgi:hypothetical protein